MTAKLRAMCSESLLQEQMDAGKIWDPKYEHELNKVNKSWVKIAFYIV